MKGNLIVAQSGGPTSVINSTLLGVIKEAVKREEIGIVYGSLYGIEGLIIDKIIDLQKEESCQLEKLINTPSAILGSTRYLLSKDYNSDDYYKILSNLKKHNIHYILIIGGNDSMDTALKLHNFFISVDYQCNVIGIPKTIDNDLVLTDHSPGYGSAIKYIATVVQEIYQDIHCYKQGRVTIVEIMGRDSGWLTAGSKLASLNEKGPDLIYLPEVSFDTNAFLNDVKTIYEKKKKVLVCVSEGIKNKDNQYVAQEYLYLDDNDVFGHLQLGGIATVLSHIVKQKLAIPVRAIELNLPQRCASHHSSLTDIKEAIKAGSYAVRLVMKSSGKMVIFNRLSNQPYKIKYGSIAISKVANKVAYVPLSWIKNHNDVAEEFIKYALPLIQGQPKYEVKNGLIDFSVLNDNIIK